MITHAKENGYAVPAVNVQGGNYDVIRAICDAAEELRSPIILAYYAATGEYCGIEWFAVAAKWVAQHASVPVAIHLDHGDSFDICMQALKQGFTSIMLDRSQLSIDENARQTLEVMKVCHAFGVPLEAEVGELVRLDDVDAARQSANIADLADIRRFLDLCRPDMLAVGIGNAHGFYRGTPDIRLDVLEATRKMADIPLVLHGCTGMDDDTVRKAIAIGVAKINFGTMVRYRYMECIREGIDTLDHNGHMWKVSRYAKEKLQETIAGIIRLSGSENRV